VNRQLKVWVESGLLDSFKQYCSANGLSQSQAVSSLLINLLNVGRLPKQRPVETRRQRRAAVNQIIKDLARVRDGEQVFLDRVPENLQDGEWAEKAAETIDQLKAIQDQLDSVYND